MTDHTRRPALILGVDDDPAVLASLRRLLRDEPYEFETTLDPAEAIERVGRGGVALVMTDHRMPRMSGAQLLEVISERWPSTLRVMLTAYPDPHVIVQRSTRVIDRLITKPWDDHELRQSLRELLDHPEQ